MARKSAAELAIVANESGVSRHTPPKSLGAEAQQLWHNIMSDIPDGHFTLADMGLLEELCRHQCELIPAMDEKIKAEGMSNQNLSMRNMLIKSLVMLGTKLRLVLSSRSRGDLASMRDINKNSINLDWSKVDAD